MTNKTSVVLILMGVLLNKMNRLRDVFVFIALEKNVLSVLKQFLIMILSIGLWGFKTILRFSFLSCCYVASWRKRRYIPFVG